MTLNNRNIFTIPYLITMRMTPKYLRYLQHMEHGKAHFFILNCMHFSDAQSLYSSLQRQSRTKKTSVPCLDGYGTCTSREWENMIRPQPIMRRKMSDPDIHHGNFHVLSSLVMN